MHVAGTPPPNMVCSVCGGAGHNKRTCIAKKLDDAGVPDNVKDQVAEFLTNGIKDEALAQAIELGLDVMVPGLGTCIKLGRYGWKWLSK